MKKFLSILVLIIVMMVPINTDAITKTPSAEIETEYSVKDDMLNVKKVIELDAEYETKNLEDTMKINDENGEVIINKVLVEDNNGEKEIKAYKDNKEDYYKIEEKSLGNTLEINFKDPINVKKISLDYSYKKVISHFEKDSFNYIKVRGEKSFRKFKVKEEKIKMDNSIKECWVGNSFSDFVENDDFKEMKINGNDFDDKIIMAFDKNNGFLSYEQNNIPDPDMDGLGKRSSFKRLFTSHNKKSLKDIMEEILGLAFVFGSTALVICLLIKRAKKKKTDGKLEHEIYKNNENKVNYDAESYTDSYYNENDLYNDEPFKMPSYINPAYIGILFNTTKEDIILTILCELIRKDALEVKLDDNYRKDTDVYKKYVLSLTENDIKLENFEETFIKKIREMDFNNLDDINKLVGNGYFDLVVQEADEEFNEYLRDNLKQDASVDEILKNKNVELDKWVYIRKQMTQLKVEEIKKLTIKELELLHVFSTAVALRDESFSLFKIFTKTELRMSKYFGEIQQTFDNGDTVLNYLETTFLE